MEKKNILSMTLAEKLNYVRYSNYYVHRYSIDDYVKAFDYEFLSEAIKSPYTININRMLNFLKLDINEIFKKYSDSSNHSSNLQLKFLEYLIIMGNENASKIIETLPNEDRKLIVNVAVSRFSQLKNGKAGNFLVALSVSLDSTSFAEVLNQIGELNEEDLNNFISSILNNGNFDINANRESVLQLLTKKDIKAKIAETMESTDFYYLVERYNLGDDLILQRKSEKLKILQNSSKMSLKTVQNALSDLMFRENSYNAVLSIETILNYADSNEEYKVHLASLYDYLKEVKDFFKIKTESQDYEQTITKQIKSLYQKVERLEANGIEFYNLFNKEVQTAKGIFYDSLEDCITDTGKSIFEGIKSDYLECENIKVPVYKIEKQTPNQERFYILAHTQQVSGDTKEEIRESYYNRRKNSSTICCTLIDQSHLVTFANGGRVVFGYFSFQNADLLSATTRDGQTGQRYIAIRKDRKVFQQRYINPQEFMQETDHYNEITFKTDNSLQNGTLNPNVIICIGEPSKRDILSASAFNIPIIKIEKELYEQQNNDKHEPMKEYLYPVFDRPESRNVCKEKVSE